MENGQVAGRGAALPSSQKVVIVSLLWAVACLIAPWGLASAETVRVDITPGHATNTFSPLKALGAGVDARKMGAVKQIYVTSTLNQMLAAGWGALSYRLYTELSVQHWHWNPQGSWSDPAGQGYWTSSTTSSEPITDSFGYRLPHRGFTKDEGNNDDYSRLTDGDPTTYWKSNPYLTEHFTGEPDVLHPQWVVVDLGAKKPVNAIRIHWVEPHATEYQVQYWTGSDAIERPAKGQWVTFPSGAVSEGIGGTINLKLSSSAISVRFLRIWMTASSNSCDTHGPGDLRNCVGYAVGEIDLGTLSSDGRFTDLVRHVAKNTQTKTYASSVDPWHAPSNQVENEEQPGLDLVFTSGLTRGLAAMVSVGMLYGTPEDAAAEIAYLETRKYPISYVELGEEPDGQHILPEDYGALYLQWARALHAVDPNLKLGGPVFEGVNSDVAVWPDAKGNTSWLQRFLQYLRSHDRLSDLSFMSFEHYPFEACDDAWRDNLDEPALVNGIVQAWKADGLPAGIPMFITEYNFGAGTTSVFQDLAGALWHADFVGSFLTAGGSGAFYYQYEPEPLSPGGPCKRWGAFGMFPSDKKYRIRTRGSQFFSSQLITQQWVQPIDVDHQVYPATSDIKNPNGKTLVTAYAVLRPDGQWALLLVNKDKVKAHKLSVTFHDASTNRNLQFNHAVTQITFGRAQYQWHPKGASGYPKPDGPPVTTALVGGARTKYLIPAASITVLRGKVE